MERYSQQDARWGAQRLGWGTATIATDGCLLTSLAMLCTDLGFTETPLSLNEKMIAVGAFVKSNLIVRLLPQAVPGVRLSAAYACEDSPAPLAEMNAHLLNGEKVVAQVDASAQPGLQPHWVILERILPAGDYEIVDPWPIDETNPVSLLARYGTGAKRADRLIHYAFVLAAEKPPAEPPSAFKRLRITAPGGINLRLGPSVTAPRLATLPPGLELEVLDVQQTQDGVWCVPRLYLASEYDDKNLVTVLE